MNRKLSVFSILLYATCPYIDCSSSTSSTAVATKVGAQALVAFAKEAEQDSHERVAELIRQGADCNAKDDQGKTALHYFAEKGFEGSVNILLYQKRIACDEPDTHFWTPLHCAARGSHLGIVRELLRKGAQADAATDTGEIPLELVPEYETLPDEILNTTEQEASKISPHHSQAAQCLFLLFRGLVDTRSKNGKVARGRVMLHYAVELLNPAFVKIILQPDPPFSASFSNAPENREFVHSSAMSTSTKLHYFVKDDEGLTPLHLLAKKFPDEVAFAIQNAHKSINTIKFSSTRAKLVYKRFMIFYDKTTSLSKTKLIEDLKEAVPSLPI